MVCDFCVSPIVPSRKTLYPASPFLQWVAKVSLPHLPVQQSIAETSVIWSAKTSKCSSRVCSLFAIRPRYLASSVFMFVSSTSTAELADRQDSPHQCRDFAYSRISQYHSFTQGNIWISRVPELPLWAHALVSDPGGVLNTCHSAFRTAAFRSIQSVGFSLLRGYPMTTTIHFSGLNTEPASLLLSGFGLPLPGLPSDFTNDLLAKLWSCGTFLTSVPEQALQRGGWQFCHPITHWVTISNFKDSLPYPNDSDLSRHKNWPCYIS